MNLLSKKFALPLGLMLIVVVSVGVALFTMNHQANASAIEQATPTRARSQAAAPQPPARSNPTPTPEPAIPVRASVVSVKADGNLVSASQATLAFQSAGRIKVVNVKEGDRVKAGDVIATLDTSSLDAQVVQAQATLDSAVANLAKVKAGPTVDDTIVAKSAVDRAKAALDQAQAAYDKIGGDSNPRIGETQQALNLQQAYSNYQSAVSQYHLTVDHPTDAELKAAQATVAQAQAALEAAKIAVVNARIVAPFDGTVIWLNSKLGESATTGSAQVMLADLSKMQVQVNVDESSIATIKVGETVTVTVDAMPDKPLAGKVSQVGLLATATGNLVYTPITIDINSTSTPIYSGLSAAVEIQGANQ